MTHLFFLCVKEIPIMNNPTDEIDLLTLLAKIILAIKNNLIALIIAFIIGSGLGLAYYQFNPNVYESEVIITSDILTESYSKSVFTTIQKLIKENNLGSLSKILHLTESQAEAIQKIELKGTIEKSDGLQEQNKMYISITVKSMDNTIWPDLQAGIVAFIENNDFVKIRVTQRKKYFTSLITKIDHELGDLEIMKSKIMDGKLSSNNSSDGMLLLDPTTINTKILELSKEKINYQNGLELVNSVQIVESFTAFNKPISPKLSISLGSGASLGLFFVFVFIGIKSLRKLIRIAEDKIEKV
jgi:hypothetical protein